MVGGESGAYSRPMEDEWGIEICDNEKNKKVEKCRGVNTCLCIFLCNLNCEFEFYYTLKPFNISECFYVNKS